MAENTQQGASEIRYLNPVSVDVKKKKYCRFKKLAYPIQKKTTGFYFLVEFTGEGSIINTLETQYRRDERIIRFLTFKQDKFAVEYSQKRRAKLANKTQE